MLKEMLKECAIGFVWAVFVLSVVFVHYSMCIDVPEFRYLGF